MPSNEQRRAAAKRKLERQLANRAQRARRRKQLTIAGTALGVVIAVAAVTGVYFLTRGDDSDNTASEATEASQSMPPAAPLPAAQPKPAMVNCVYNPAPQPAAKPVQPPSRTEIPTEGPGAATLSVSIQTNEGPIGLTLNNAESPCTVNSFASLAGQGYYDGTTCHRLSNMEGFKMLQCGDPNGDGSGGPGYQFANEYPTDQFAPGDPATQEPALYKRGTIAMANSDRPGVPSTGTNGGQFFLVYGDTQLPPNYTVFGTIDEPGLATLEKVGAAGDDGSSEAGGGKPNLPVTFESVRID